MTAGEVGLPRGFRTHTGSIGIKDAGRDVALVLSEVDARVAGLYTRSRFAGPSVALSREVTARGRARALVVISKNANVANGEVGDRQAAELQQLAAASCGVEPRQVVVASTGVIGRTYPMEAIREYFARGPELTSADFAATAEAIMTTDTHPKLSRRTVDGAVIVGIAKGVGMIEPDMATLLTFFFTDADLPAPDLNRVFRRVVARTFNALSIDSDTSTSDSAVIFANGLAGPVDEARFEAAVGEVALDLVLMIAADGEGARRVMEVVVSGARDDDQAKRVAKAIVNSPLVKTAVHGADPNWGRVVMAVGKCQDDTDITPERVVVRIGEEEMYPAPAGPDALGRAAHHMSGDHVLISVDLGIGTGGFTVYGCDLSDGYVRINADYTT